MNKHFATDLKREQDLAKRLGLMISSKRESLGLTQDQVAGLVGIGNQAISRIERGAVMPTIPRLFQFADVFKCGIDELLLSVSDRGIDRAVALEKDLSTLQPKHRDFIANMVQQLSDHLKGESRERVPRR